MSILPIVYLILRSAIAALVLYPSPSLCPPASRPTFVCLGLWMLDASPPREPASARVSFMIFIVAGTSRHVVAPSLTSELLLMAAAAAVRLLHLRRGAAFPREL